MQGLLNAARREAERTMSQRVSVRMGVVSAYDPGNYSAKVRIQPEDHETGWLPVHSPWSGDGWGLFCPPTPGEVVEVHYQEGGKGAPFVGLRQFGDVNRPVAVPSGEFWIVHKSGSRLNFHGDGTIEMIGHSNINITAPSVNIAGNLNVTGDIIDRYLSGGYTMASFRATYDLHTHGNVTGGGDHTAIPDEIL